LRGPKKARTNQKIIGLDVEVIYQKNLKKRIFHNQGITSRKSSGSHKLKDLTA
jgi:hypothetical protein